MNPQSRCSLGHAHGRWLLAGDVVLGCSPPLCGRSVIDLLMCAPLHQWAAMIFLHCWPHKLSDQPSIAVREQRKQQNTPSDWVTVGPTVTALMKQAVHNLSSSSRWKYTLSVPAQGRWLGWALFYWGENWADTQWQYKARPQVALLLGNWTQNLLRIKFLVSMFH